MEQERDEGVGGERGEVVRESDREKCGLHRPEKSPVDVSGGEQN